MSDHLIELDASRAVTLKDIAEYCGVSLGTVSLALRDDPRISSDTRARVLAAAARLGYDPTLHQAARRLALSKHGRDVLNHVIALIVPSGFHQPGYFAELMHGIMDVLVPAGFCALISYIYSNEDEQETPIPTALRAGIVDGLISMVRPEPVMALLDTLRRQPGFARRPTASLIWEMPGSSCVRADDEAAGYALTRRLLALGHRHFLQLTFLLPYSKTPEPQTYRIAGARRALAEAGLDPHHHLLLADMSNFKWLDPEYSDSDNPELARVWVDGREVPLVEVLRARPEITAVLGLNDASALHAWWLLEQAGYRVPADYSIVGFDDTTPRLDAAGENLLTSARVPLQEIGRNAARLIIEQATATDPRPPTELVLPVEVAFRGSVGPAHG